MPGSEPTLLECLADSRLRPVLIAWSKRMYNDDQVGFLIDYNAKKPMKYLYETYIPDTAPKTLNFGDTEMKAIRELGAKGEAGFAKMGPAMADVFELTRVLIDNNFRAGSGKFAEGKEYQTYLNATKDPTSGKVLMALKLTGAKRTAFEPLLEVYLKARSLEDAYAAYKAMLKIVAKAKLDPALASAGKPAVDFPSLIAAAKAKLAAENLAREVDKLLPNINTELTAAKKYFTDALVVLKLKGRPAVSIEVTRMFNSGRMRMEKLDAPYLKAVKADKTFTTRHTALVAEKKKVNGQYADFKKLLGK
jgi:hypothetical protein